MLALVCTASPFLSWIYSRPVTSAGRLFHLKAAALTGGKRDNPMSLGNGPWPPHTAGSGAHASSDNQPSWGENSF
jgi:hypothetical protein